MPSLKGATGNELRAAKTMLFSSITATVAVTLRPSPERPITPGSDVRLASITARSCEPPGDRNCGDSLRLRDEALCPFITGTCRERLHDVEQRTHAAMRRRLAFTRYQPKIARQR